MAEGAEGVAAEATVAVSSSLSVSAIFQFQAVGGSQPTEALVGSVATGAALRITVPLEGAEVEQGPEAAVGWFG